MTQMAHVEVEIMAADDCGIEMTLGEQGRQHFGSDRMQSIGPIAVETGHGARALVDDFDVPAEQMCHANQGARFRARAEQGDARRRRETETGMAHEFDGPAQLSPRPLNT